MQYSIHQIKNNITSIDRQLLLMIYEEQCETNRLLRLIANEKEQGNEMIVPDDHINAAESEIDTLKRPQLMQLMAKQQNKPQGWNKWETEDIRKHLKGAS